MKRPEEMTATGFCKLAEKTYNALYGDSLAQFAARVHVKESILRDILWHHRLPKKSTYKATEVSQERAHVGYVVRISDALQLDVDACLDACDFRLSPTKKSYLIMRARELLMRFDVTDLEEVIEFLKKQGVGHQTITPDSMVRLISIARSERK